MNASAPADQDPEPQILRLMAHKPLNLLDEGFQQNKYAYYAYLREHLPVHPIKIMGINLLACSRYEDCLFVLKDPRFKRNRTNVTGGSRLPFPLPAPMRLLSHSMIVEDDPEHRRLRALVQKAFAPGALGNLEERLTVRAHALLDQCLDKGDIDLKQEYALPIPSAVIAEMMGVREDEMPAFQNSISALTQGMSGWSVLRTVLWDLGQAVKFVRALIARKRGEPGEDILTQLIEAEEDGDRLTEDELVSMVFLLIVAGFETTVHLVTNGVHALLTHPEAQATLRAEPQLIGSALEEMLRFCGPVHGTKPNYATEDIELRGVVIPKGMPVMPFLGAANHDPAVFTDPEEFNIRRDPNKHLAFSQGNHFCLGAFLARMEARVAINVLLERAGSIELRVPQEELVLQRVPGWHRYKHFPVKLAV